MWATKFSWPARIEGCDYGEHNPWTVTARQHGYSILRDDESMKSWL
jgi:hypothetical protein